MPHCKCGEANPENFYSYSKSECKECVKSRVRLNRYKNIEYYKEFDRKRSNLPHRVEARSIYAKTIEGIIAGNRGKLAYIKRNPEKRSAHIMVSNAIRDGKLTRQSCEVCGDKSTHAHHDDYSRPLEVRWLCPQCHSDEHRISNRRMSKTSK